MTSNPALMVQPRQDEVHNLLAYVTGPNARAQTASSVELPVGRRWLALGAARLRLFFVRRAAGRPAEPVPAPDGRRLLYDDQRPTTDSSVGGNGRFARHACTAPGHAGSCPLDAARSLPAHGAADLLREWAGDGATDASSRASQTVRERIVGGSRSRQARDTGVAEAGDDGGAFDAQPVKPTPASPGDTILVVQADGTGVPMLQPPTQTPPVRLGGGQKRPTKKAAVVTGLYPIAPDPRPPQEVGAARRQAPSRLEPAARPQPVGKDRRATLAGQAEAMRHVAARVAQRDGPHLPPHVALTDGAEALPLQVVPPCPA